MTRQFAVSAREISLVSAVETRNMPSDGLPFMAQYATLARYILGKRFVHVLGAVSHPVFCVGQSSLDSSKRSALFVEGLIMAPVSCAARTENCWRIVWGVWSAGNARRKALSYARVAERQCRPAWVPVAKIVIGGNFLESAS